MVGELRRKLGPIMTLVLLLGMGVDVLDPFGVSAEAPALFRVRDELSLLFREQQKVPPKPSLLATFAKGSGLGRYP